MDTYATFVYVTDFPELTAATLVEVDRMTSRGNVAGAARLRAAYQTLHFALVKLEGETAIEGTAILRDWEKKTRVRPDSGQQGPGPHLNDHLHCDPLGVRLVGSVGIANETELDQEVPWWYTNEEGSTGRIGGILHGYFQPGDSAPDSTLFRQHPIFESAPGDREAGWGVIKNPIPARRFIEKAFPEIEAAWRVKFDILKAAFMVEMTVAQGMGVVLP